MRVKQTIRSARTPLAVGFVLLWGVLLATVIYLTQKSHNPLPSDIKKQVSYSVFYPSKGSQIDSSSYKYEQTQGSLSFVVDRNGNNVVFTEQPAPGSLGSDSQPYYQALGIHPYAQFKTKLGTVALTKFWQTGTLTPVGQSAVLSSHGTFLIAHSEKNLANAEWKALFDSLKISR